MTEQAKRKQGKKTKLVLGIGVNDSLDPVTRYEKRGIGKQRMIWKCQIYAGWYRMLDRCYGILYLSKNPSYRDCKVDESWHKFSVFRDWMMSQDWEGKEVDKDLLIKGNKVYSAETCLLVSPQVNRFLTERGADRGKHPLGVNHAVSRGNKFEARCCNPFTIKQELIGRFTCPIQAHKAWQSRKHEHAVAMAAMQDDPRISKALIERYAPGTIHL